MKNGFRYQRTIKNIISCNGIGLHLGNKANLTLKPAPEGTGIQFYRKDMGDKYPLTKAVVENITDTRFATTIGYNGNSVHTIEHLMAALSGMGIDNAVIEVDNVEVPIMDGSAAPFVSLLKEAGFKEQDAVQPYIKITKPIELTDGRKGISIAPADKLGVTFYISYDHPLISEQEYTYTAGNGGFEKEIARARTYGFLKEVKQLTAIGLAKGGSLDNAIVVDEDGILNVDGLRFRDEFVRHKILDLLGDIALLGMPVTGHITAKRSGHSLNIRFLEEILKRRDCWVLVGSETPIAHSIEEKEMSVSASPSVPAI